MSKSFSEYRKNFKFERWKRNFLNPINEFKSIRLVSDNPHMTGWFLPIVYLVNVVVHFQDNWYPSVIVWSIATILCFVKVWETTPFLKKMNPKHRIFGITILLVTGLVISLILKSIIRHE